MPGLPNEFAAYLKKFGVSEKHLQRIRFGGVVGKMALVAISAVVPVAIIAFKANGNSLLWGCLATTAVIALGGVGAIARHADRHPAEATLEGTEVVAFHHLQQELAAKGRLEIPSSPPKPEGFGRKQVSEDNEGAQT